MKVTGRILVGWLPAVVILVVGPWLVAAQQTDDEARTSPSAITTADQAVELALEYTGFDDTAHASIGAIDEPVLAPTPHDSLSPVQYSELGGRQAWRVTMRDVVLEIEGAGPESNAETPRDVAVYIDARTGVFLKAAAGYSGPDYDQDWLFRALHQIGAPRYHSAQMAERPVKKSLLLTMLQRCAKGAQTLAQEMDTDHAIAARHPLSYRETEFYYLMVPDPSDSANPSDSVIFWLIVGKDFAISNKVPGREGEPLAVQPSILYWPAELNVDGPCRLCIMSELSSKRPGWLREKYRGRSF
jgi:hypothetical protein